jgi:TPR repeat protein
MRAFGVATAFFLSVVAMPAQAGPVEPAIPGTWKLDYPGSAIYWTIRDDGVYRLYGPGAKPPQLGKIEAGQGRWSTQPPFTATGPYQLIGADTWQVTGPLGVGTWKKIWSPAKAPSAGGPCPLLTNDEAAAVLRAPVTIDPNDPRRGNGCIFKSQLNSADQLAVTTHLIHVPDWHRTRMRTDGAPKAEIQGVREGAYASIDGGGYLVGRLLKGNQEALLRVSLTPRATLEDTPTLGDAVRALDKRGFVAAAPATPDQLGALLTTKPQSAAPPAATVVPPPVSKEPPPKPITNYQAPRLPDAKSQQDYLAARSLYDNKRYAEALRAFLPVAERGDSRAQAMIGNIYHLGRGMKVDERQAFIWYEKSAAQGNRQAEHFLADMYWQGWEDHPRDFSKSAAYWKAAALKGMKEAQTAYGYAHEFGEGVPRDRKLAIYWMMLAEKQGDRGAKWLLPWLLRKDTPHFAKGEQLDAYINAKIEAFVAQHTPGGGGAPSSSSGGGGGSAPAGCAYSSYAACNAAKAGDTWAADRIENRTSNPSEKAWYGR